MVKEGLIKKARILRTEETQAEKMLWQELRNNKLGIKWRRQHPIDMYILDFYAPEIKLGIEIDGSVHKSLPNKKYDEARTIYLEIKTIIVIRFWNSEVEKDIKKVLNKVKQKITELSKTKTKTLSSNLERVG